MSWMPRVVFACCAALALSRSAQARAQDPARDPQRALPGQAASSGHNAQATRPGDPDADAALRGLFGGNRTSVDPELAELEALWAELAAEPLAQTAGKPGLERAQAELLRLRQLIAGGAGPRSVARSKQLVWAALSLSDRQMARAELAAALRSALERRAEAEARLREARRVREATQLRLDQARGAGPSPAAGGPTK